MAERRLWSKPIDEGETENIPAPKGARAFRTEKNAAELDCSRSDLGFMSASNTLTYASVGPRTGLAVCEDLLKMIQDFGVRAKSQRCRRGEEPAFSVMTRRLHEGMFIDRSNDTKQEPCQYAKYG